MGSTSSKFSVVCPSCDSPIEVNDILRDQIRSQVESDFEIKVKLERRQIADLRKSLEDQQNELLKSQESLNDLVTQELEKRRAELEAKVTKQARSIFEVELKDQQSQIQEMTARLDSAQKTELELRLRERALKAEQAELKLKVARELESEREKLVEQVKIEQQQDFDLKQREKDKTIDDMRKKIDDLKRKAEQGSQQLQGEVQELALEELLTSTFRFDTIEPIKKGVFGGDLLQHVTDSSGHSCGLILWESKRAKTWQPNWLAKLRDDQRNSQAGCAILVSEVLPSGITTFGVVDGIWVCSWSCVVGLATAIRLGLIDLTKASLAAEGQAEKMELVYQYLAGQEFQRRVSGIVESFVSLKSELEQEMRAMHAIWRKRSKQLDRGIVSASGMYGDLQGIVGAALPVLEELDLAKIAGQSETSSASKTIQARISG